MSLPGYDKLIEITQGDDCDVDVYYRQVPNGQRLVSAILCIKASVTDTNDAAVYRVTITPTVDATGNQILADGATTVTGVAYRNLGTIQKGTALMHWLLPDDFVATLTAGREYFYGVQTRSSAGRLHEPEHGVIRTIQQINFG